MTYDSFKNDKLDAINRKIEDAKRGVIPTSQKQSGLGWAENLGTGVSVTNIFDSAEVFADTAAFYKERDGKEFTNSEELKNYFLSDRTWRNVNTVYIGKDVSDAYSMSPEQATRLSRMQRLHDVWPKFYQEGGRGLYGLAENAVAGIIDPVNIFGGLAGKAAGAGAMQAAKAGMKQHLKNTVARGARAEAFKQSRGKIVRQVAKEGFIAGAKAEAKVEAGISAVQDGLLQSRDIELGLQDEFSQKRLLENTAMGAGMGAAFGGAFGAGGAIYGDKISKSLSNARSNIFGDPEVMKNYTSEPASINETLETQVDEVVQPTVSKEDQRVDGYVKSNREQYQRNLDAVIDLIREESGDRQLADWQAGRVKEKTEAMQLADSLRESRKALEELYNWPKVRQSITRNIEALSTNESPKPEVLKNIVDLNDKLLRGDDAYNSLVRAASDKETSISSVIDSYIETSSIPNDATPSTRINETAQAQTAVQNIQSKQTMVREVDASRKDFIPSFSNDSQQLLEVGEPSLVDEIQKIDDAEFLGTSVDQSYKTSIHNRFKELTGREPQDAIQIKEVAVETPEAPVVKEEPLPSTPEELSSAIDSVDKKYNAVTNKLSRIRKTIGDGKATPEQREQLKQLRTERESIKQSRIELKELQTRISVQESQVLPEAKPIEKTPEALAYSAPVDVNGVSEYLSDFGFDANVIKQDFGSYLTSQNVNSPSQRAIAARKFVQEKIEYSRSLSVLESTLEKFGETVAYYPRAMRVMIDADTELNAVQKQQVMSRYNEWLDINSPNILAKYLSENEALDIDDVFAIIEDRHGKEMLDSILNKFEGDDTIQSMSGFRKEPMGWDKLTPDQQKTIDTRLTIAKAKLKDKLGSSQVSSKKIDELIELQKHNMVLDTLYNDFEVAMRTSAKKLGDNYPIIVDPDSKRTISGKTWKHKTGDAQPTVDKRDRFGIQSMLQRATSGRASGVDPEGNLVIEYPYFGTLMVRDIVRKSDGSIDYDKTIDGKYIVQEKADGTSIYVPRKYSAAESARRELEQSVIDTATNRWMRADRDVAGIKEGERVTEKQFKAALVEEARLNKNRNKQNKIKTGSDIDADAEELNKALRNSLRKVVVNDAVRNAIATSETPQRAADANISQAEAFLGEEITLAEREASWSQIEVENREIAVEKSSKEMIKEAHERFLMHQDFEAYVAELKKIKDTVNPKVVSPKAHIDKPAGAKAQPRMYVHRGWEVDIRNHFGYKKISDDAYAVSFLNEKVADLTVDKDGTATMYYTDIDGLESTVKASSTDKMADNLPRLFGDRIELAGQNGALRKSVDANGTTTYPIDWKASNTWGKQTRTIPAETEVLEPIKVMGKVEDWKTNKDVSAANLEIPEGHVLSVQILDGKSKGVTRVESDKTATPQTVGSILGKQQSAYTIGYVPVGTKSASMNATEQFRPIDATDQVYKPGAGDTSSAKGITPSIKEDDFGQMKLEDLGSIAIQEENLPVKFRGEFAGKKLNTLAKVQDLLMSMENVPWNKIASKKQYMTFTQDLADLYAVRQQYAPKGIKLPNASRVQSMRQWERLMANQDPVSLSTGIDILRRLSFNDRALPIISGKDMGNNAGGFALPLSASDNPNKIFLNPDALNPDGKGNVFPQPITLLHEVGHWAYTNVLSDADRMQFWQSLGKYFNDDTLDVSAIRRRLPGISPDEQMSPAELFANQFTQWSITEGKVNNIPLWTKMARKIVQIAEAFGVRVGALSSRKDANLVDIDPDFVELFTKILPDNHEMYNRYVELYKVLEDARNLDSSAHTKVVSLSAKVMVDFDDLRRRIDDAIETANPDDLANALDEVSREIYGKVGGKAGAFRHRPNNDGTPGASRLRIFDGMSGGKQYKFPNARRALLKAHYDWRNFQKEMYSEGKMKSSFTEISTDDLELSDSGDLNSSFEAITTRASGAMDNDLLSSLNLHANNIINSISIAQDEARGIIESIGRLEGKRIRVSKDGVFSSYAENPYSKTKRETAIRRRAATNQVAEQELDSIVKEITNREINTDDRSPVSEDTMDVVISRPSATKMSIEQLKQEYKSLAGQRTARKKEIEAQLKAYVASIPEVSISPISAKYEDYPLKKLEKEMFSSIKRGKFDETNELVNAMAWRKRQNLSDGLITATSPKVQKAIKRIKEDNANGTYDNGVPVNASVHARETIKSVTHRNKTEEYTSRIVTHRLVSILNQDAQSNVTIGDIAKIMGDVDNSSTEPVNESNILFQQFRGEMRQIGKDLKSANGTVHAAQKISRMVINATSTPDELSNLGTSADELSAGFVAVMRRKAGIDEIFDSLPEASRIKIADMYKENMETTAMVMNGLINKGRDELQPMTFYGNMFLEKEHSMIYTNASKLTPFGHKAMHPELAEGYRKEFVSNLTPEKHLAVQGFTNRPIHEAIAFYDGNGSVPTALLEAKGYDAPPLEDGAFGKGVYLKKNISAIDSQSLPNNDLMWATDNIKRIRNKLTIELANLEGMKGRGLDVGDFRVDVVDPLVSRLRKAIATESTLWSIARTKDGIDAQPKVIPYIPAMHNTFDMSNTAEYSFGSQSPNSLDWLMAKMEAEDIISMKDAEALRNSVTTLTGNELYATLSTRIADKLGVSPTEANNVLNDVFKKIGFDSIDTGEGYVVFDSKNIRHAESPEFELDSVANKMDMASNGRRFMAGELFEQLMIGDVNTKDTDGLVDMMQHMAIPAMASDVMKKQFQKKPLNLSDINKIADTAAMTFTKVFGENSIRARKSGATWLADKIKPKNGVGFFDQLDADRMKALIVSKDENGRPQSILTKLRNIPDAKQTMGKRWLERNKFWKNIEAPTSHKVMLMALRLGEVDKLPTRLKETAKDVQKFFQQELKKAHDAGLPIGYKKNYIPQVWDADVIKSEQNAFVMTMKSFFMREMKDGNVPTPIGRSPSVVAEEKALRLFTTLTSEGNDGVLIPDNSLRTKMEDPFYERIINLTPDEIPEASRFLINDLEGMIAKYSDQINRRVILAERFGLGNHAASTYMNILVNGKEAVVSALRNTKLNGVQRRAADATMDERVTVTSEIVSPIEGEEFEVVEMVDIAVDMLGDTPEQWQKNKERVRNYLLNLQDPDIVASQPEFVKRIDAIVNALAEYGGEPSGIPSSEINAMASMIGTMGMKPLENPGIVSPKFSRQVRTFNNISLLAFTTLASIPDIGMPIIRSGNLKAGYEGWKKYMSDPHYREMARNVGVGLENILHEKMAHMYHDTASKVSNSFFNFTFLNQWTNIQREASALIAYESFKAEARKAQELASRGMQNTAKYKTSLRFLGRYGLERYGMPGAKSLDTPEEMVKNDELRYAIMRFTNESIFAPNPNDIPLWAQTPAGAMIFQLKSFPLMMGRMAKFVVDEAVQGNPKHLMALFASAGVLGTTSLAVRDVVQMRGDTDGDGKVDQLTRDRYATDSKMTGAFVRWYNNFAGDMGIETGSNADAVIGWLAEAFMVQGGFGLFADLLHSTVEQADNRAYGTLRTMGAIAGPSFSLAADAVEVTQAGLQQVFSEEPKNSDERNAIRKIVGRVPIVGGIRGVKEAVVDTVAGEAEDKKSSSPNKIIF